MPKKTTTNVEPTEEGKSYIKSVWEFIYGALVIVLILIAIATTFSVLQVPQNFRIFVVETGSMEPALPTGSLIAVVPESEYSEGDILTFIRTESNNQFFVTHRLAQIIEPEIEQSTNTPEELESDTATEDEIPIENELDLDAETTESEFNVSQTMFQTKGDANNVEDSELVNPSDVIGKVQYHIPYIGYPVGFAKTQMGFILLVVIPATIIVYSELLTIKKELADYFSKRRQK